MKAVAVIGASNDRRKFGNKAVRGYLQQGYTVFPINSQESEVEGIPAYTSGARGAAIDRHGDDLPAARGRGSTCYPRSPRRAFRRSGSILGPRVPRSSNGPGNWGSSRLLRAA